MSEEEQIERLKAANTKLRRQFNEAANRAGLAGRSERDIAADRDHWKLRAEQAEADNDRMRKILEIIAGEAADKLQATQARGALTNIGPKI